MNAGDTLALRPDAHLLDGGCAKRIARAEEHLLAFFLPAAGQLSDGGGLPRTVDPDDQDHLRRPGLAALRGDVFREQAGHVLLQALQHFLLVADAVLSHFLLERCEQVGGRAVAHIGEQQDLLQFFEQRVVDVGAAMDDLIDASGQGIAGFRQARLEAGKKPDLLLLGFNGIGQCSLHEFPRRSPDRDG